MKYTLLPVLLTMFCCKNDNANIFKINAILENYKIENFSKYENIYNNLLLDLQSQIDNYCEDVQELLFTDEYLVDELLLINESETKLVGIVCIPETVAKNCTSDWIFMFSGKKVDDKWFFFRGGSLFVPRQNYIYNINKMLTYDQLKLIGRDFFLKSFYKISNGEVEINSDAIDNYVSLKKEIGFSNEDSSIDWKSNIDKRNARIISKEEINRIKSSIENEVHQDAIIPKKGTKAFRELYGDGIPLFEREEWKNLEKK